VQRVLVVGPCGAGKSTLSFELARLTGLPLHHMDRLNWGPGWVAASCEQLVARLEPILAEPRWIIDGNYAGTLPLRLARADTVVLLDYPRRIYLRRVVQRIVLARWADRPDMADGCDERFSREFLRFVWRFHVDSRPRLLRRLAERGDGVSLVTLRHPRDARDYLARLSISKSP
jgi:adenylate kinase family enzyme